MNMKSSAHMQAIHMPTNEKQQDPKPKFKAIPTKIIRTKKSQIKPI